MINIKEARSYYAPGSGLYIATRGTFSKYSPAYVLSNEHLAQIMAVMHPANKSVLAVAGSGDQPLCFRLHGAKHVDTFDISCCARAIMDIKTAAIQNFSETEYVGLLQKLSKESDKIKFLPEFQMLHDKMPVQSASFIDGMSGCKIVQRSAFDLENVPLKDEYSKLKGGLNKPFNFIWSDVDAISGKLTQKYDIIYLSNVMQYDASLDHMFDVVTSLLPHLNTNGRILLHVAPYFIGNELNVFAALRAALGARAQVQLHRSKLQELCVVKKL